MSKFRMSVAAAVASLMALSGVAQAQSANTDERTNQSEMQRGVPGEDVDTGRRADGAVDVDTSAGQNQQTERGLNTDASADTRAPRADRN